MEQRRAKNEGHRIVFLKIEIHDILATLNNTRRGLKKYFID